MVVYHFYHEHYFNAPIEKVWAILDDAESWPKWSKGFKKMTRVNQESEAKVGSLLDCEVKGDLPYTIRFRLKVTHYEPPNRMGYHASGALEGTGKWELETRKEGTFLQYYWDVGTTNPFFNLFAKIPGFKKIMEKNHDKVMDDTFENMVNILKIR